MISNTNQKVDSKKFTRGWNRVFGKCRVRVDPTVTTGEIHFQKNGRTIGKIVNIQTLNNPGVDDED